MSATVLAEMLEKMRVRETDDARTVLSKKLSYVLRHGAKQLDLSITNGGFVSVKELLAIEDLFGNVQTEDLLEVVESSNSEKQRYELIHEDDTWLIRATTKHTMEGIQTPTKKKSPKRNSKDPIRILDEEEFCQNWRLDKMARQRLADLPENSRQQAMQRFNPGPEVPESDFPKLFVAFLKRFRAKDGDEQDEGKGSSSSPSRRRGKDSPSSRREVVQEKGPDPADSSASELVASAPPFYHSPGSTPRSFEAGSLGGHSPQHRVMQDWGMLSPPAAQVPVPGLPMAQAQAPFSQPNLQLVRGNLNVPSQMQVLSTSSPSSKGAPTLAPHFAQRQASGSSVPSAPSPTTGAALPTGAMGVLGSPGFQPQFNVGTVAGSPQNMGNFQGDHNVMQGYNMYPSFMGQGCQGQNVQVPQNFQQMPQAQFQVGQQQQGQQQQQQPQQQQQLQMQQQQPQQQQQLQMQQQQPQQQQQLQMQQQQPQQQQQLQMQQQQLQQQPSPSQQHMQQQLQQQQHLQQQQQLHQQQLQQQQQHQQLQQLQMQQQQLQQQIQQQQMQQQQLQQQQMQQQQLQQQQLQQKQQQQQQQQLQQQQQQHQLQQQLQQQQLQEQQHQQQLQQQLQQQQMQEQRPQQQLHSQQQEQQGQQQHQQAQPFPLQSQLQQMQALPQHPPPVHAPKLPNEGAGQMPAVAQMPTYQTEMSPNARMAPAPPPPAHAPQVGLPSTESPSELSRPPGTFIPMRAQAESGQMSPMVCEPMQWQMMNAPMETGSPTSSSPMGDYREQVRQQLKEKLQKEAAQHHPGKEDGPNNPREQVQQQLQLKELQHMSWQVQASLGHGWTSEDAQTSEASAMSMQLQMAHQMQMLPEDAFVQQVQHQQRRLQQKLQPPPPTQMPQVPEQQWGSTTPPPPPSHAPLG